MSSEAKRTTEGKVFTRYSACRERLPHLGWPSYFHGTCHHGTQAVCQRHHPITRAREEAPPLFLSQVVTGCLCLQM